ncbi:MULTISPECIES: hypothetical protein [Chitinophagaceae]
MSNNIAVLIHDFLMERKEISLQKIGSLFLKGATITTEDGTSYPEVVFQYDKMATTTPEFIDFVTEREHKSKAIIESDVDYFLEENRQLMNIGTGVLMISGIGYVHSQKTGGYSFSQQPISGFRENGIRKKVMSDDIYDRTLDANTNELPPLRFNNTAKKTNGQANILGIIIILLVLGGAGFGIYYFLNHAKNKPNEEMLAGRVDTANIVPQKSGTVDEDSAPKENATANTSDFYKFVFEVTKDSERAHTRIAKLKAYGDKVEYDSVNTTEGLYFRLYAPVPKMADTTRAKDSLFKYFQKPIQIAKHN